MHAVKLIHCMRLFNEGFNYKLNYTGSQKVAKVYIQFILQTRRHVPTCTHPSGEGAQGKSEGHCKKMSGVRRPLTIRLTLPVGWGRCVPGWGLVRRACVRYILSRKLQEMEGVVYYWESIGKWPRRIER